MWFRVPAALPDDEHLHTALLGFATDWTGIGGRPLHLDGDTQGMVSLDHAVWFHRPARADDWLFYDVHSLVNVGGRGLLRGTITRPRGPRRHLRRAGDAAQARRRFDARVRGVTDVPVVRNKAVAAASAQWLDELPWLVAAVEREWSVSVGRPVRKTQPRRSSRKPPCDDGSRCGVEAWSFPYCRRRQGGEPDHGPSTRERSRAA